MPILPGCQSGSKGEDGLHRAVSQFLRTRSYERYIQALKSRLESKGIRTAIYDSKYPHQFVVCMWASGRRKDLAKHASEYDVVIVLGCDAAVETARQCLKSSYCRVIPGMEVEGIMNVIPTLRFPFNIWFEVSSVIRVLQQHEQHASAVTELLDWMRSCQCMWTDQPTSEENWKWMEQVLDDCYKVMKG